MKKRKLNVDTLEVSSFEPQEQVDVPGPVQGMTGSGYCNTCIPTDCDWTV